MAKGVTGVQDSQRAWGPRICKHQPYRASGIPGWNGQNRQNWSLSCSPEPRWWEFPGKGGGKVCCLQGESGKHMFSWQDWVIKPDPLSVQSPHPFKWDLWDTRRKNWLVPMSASKLRAERGKRTFPLVSSLGRDGTLGIEYWRYICLSSLRFTCPKVWTYVGRYFRYIQKNQFYWDDIDVIKLSNFNYTVWWILTYVYSFLTISSVTVFTFLLTPKFLPVLL